MMNVTQEPHVMKVGGEKLKNIAVKDNTPSTNDNKVSEVIPVNVPKKHDRPAKSKVPRLR